MGRSVKKPPKPFICDCGRAVCGVNKDYHQISLAFQTWGARNGTEHFEVERIDRKWRSLGKQAAAGRL